MIVGSYGDVSFSVSSEMVETFEKMKWTSAASFAQHKVHGEHAVVEFTGFDADKLTFEMQLSAMLGVNPQQELDKLRSMLTNHVPHPLVIGTTLIGSKWVLTNLSTEFGHIYKDGALLTCKVSVTLMGA